MQEQKEGTINLRGILTLFRKHLGAILLTTFIVTVFGALYTFFVAKPVYTTTTQLVAKLPDSENAGAYAGQVSGNIQMANTMNQVITSQAVLSKVQKNLNIDENLASHVTASNATNSQVINISVNYNDPYTAKKIADETAAVFSENVKEILNVTNVSVLSKAEVVKSPIKPKPAIYIAISAIIGLIIGAGIALLREVLNNKIVTEQDVEVLGFTVLGTTPFATAKDFKNTIPLGNERTEAARPRVPQERAKLENTAQNRVVSENNLENTAARPRVSQDRTDASHSSARTRRRR